MDQKLLEEDLVILSSMIPEMYKALKAVQGAWIGTAYSYGEVIAKVDEVIDKIEDRFS